METIIRPSSQRRLTLLLTFLFAQTLCLGAQSGIDNASGSASIPSAVSTVPLLVRFNGIVRELSGVAVTSTQSITFNLYQFQTGGDPLWSETQVVSSDNQGKFSILLGSASPQGIPVSSFSTGGPRWVGITPNDGVERSRSLLVSVPYALKAADSDTVGGKKPDEFVTQQQLNVILSGLRLPDLPGLPTPIPLPPVAYPYPIVEPLPILPPQAFTGGIKLPASIPDATASTSLDSAPLDFESSTIDPLTKSSITQRFRWTSQALSGPTSVSSARLSLLFSSNGAVPATTGLSINSDGTINFAPGQQFPTGGVMPPGTGSGGTGLNPGTTTNPIVNTAAYPWSQTPRAVALQAGANSVTLTPCPRGVNGTDLWHYLYISATGTPEPVLITGGSCTSRAPSGTIEFTGVYSHPIGYSIGTATDGVQEAVVDAEGPTTYGTTARQVTIDPGSHVFRARLSIRGTGMVLTSSGATATCTMSDTCIMMGDPANSNAFASIVLRGLSIAPGVQKGTWPAIEDNANGSAIEDFSPAAGATGANFGSLIQVDNDQAATITNLNTVTNYSWARCDTTFCSTAVIGPGPYNKNAGVLWIKNSNISLQGAANGVDNQDGNTVQVENSVIQGYAQFGIRARTVYAPNTVSLNNVFFEDDSNANPLGTGSAGLIVEGGAATSIASSPGGVLPQFANTGTTQYYYYIVVHSSTMGTSPPYLAGDALTNGSDQIKVLWNQIGTAGQITYDTLRITGDGGADMKAPYGTGSFAVATGVPTSLCSNQVCSVIDNAGSSLSSYTVADTTTYWPSLKLWPGSVILTGASDTQNTGGGNPTAYFTDQVTNGGIVNSAGATYPSVFAQECNAIGNWSPVWMQCVGGNSAGNDYPPITATLLQMSTTGGAPGGLKGRLIFELPPGSDVGPTHVITLADSDPDKTLSTPNNRPSNDPNDSYIGYDGGWFPSTMQIAFGAPVSISRYIANTGDGINYLERLTATQEQYRVPVTLATVAFSSLPALSDGTTLYCYDCKNVHDDGAMFDSDAEGGGHGSNLVHENGQWRVH
jgi:hypothetical protein